MESERDILWKYYEFELSQAINHESSRVSITNMILIITGVIITIITYDENLSTNDLPLSLFLIVVGIFGVVFNAKSYERFNFHNTRAGGYRNLLEERYPNIDFLKARELSDRENKEKFFFINKLRLNWLWLILNGLISLFGLTITIIILFT
tara:strand:- start:8981 stop:9433 length:453 start_codon:yes stop_codon:yes gene_type:complete